MSLIVKLLTLNNFSQCLFSVTHVFCLILDENDYLATYIGNAI